MGAPKKKKRGDNIVFWFCEEDFDRIEAATLDKYKSIELSTGQVLDLRRFYPDPDDQSLCYKDDQDVEWRVFSIPEQKDLARRVFFKWVKETKPKDKSYRIFNPVLTKAAKDLKVKISTKRAQEAVWKELKDFKPEDENSVNSALATICVMFTQALTSQQTHYAEQRALDRDQLTQALTSQQTHYAEQRALDRDQLDKSRTEYAQQRALDREQLDKTLDFFGNWERKKKYEAACEDNINKASATRPDSSHLTDAEPPNIPSPKIRRSPNAPPSVDEPDYDSGDHKRRLFFFDDDKNYLHPVTAKGDPCKRCKQEKACSCADHKKQMEEYVKN